MRTFDPEFPWVVAVSRYVNNHKRNNNYTFTHGHEALAFAGGICARPTAVTIIKIKIKKIR